MIKFIIVLYIICFGIYVVFSRQPDFFDGNTTRASIHFVTDSSQHSVEPYAFFAVNKDSYSVNASYLFRTYREGDIVPVIYNSAEPSKAAVLTLWGYWIRWGEIVFSALFLIILYRVAVAITNQPAPPSQIDPAQEAFSRRNKYDR